MTTHNQLFRITRSQARCRKGAIVVLAAFLLVGMLFMVAMSLDVGYMMINRGEVQRAVDAGALAGVSVLAEDRAQAEPTAREYVQYNFVGSDAVRDERIKTELGVWDSSTRTFVADPSKASAIRVWAQQQNRPLFFGKIFGHDQFQVQAEAVARFQPRDIVVVLDYSASMNDDSELSSISKLGRGEVEANLKQIYAELGSPRYGNLQWQPVSISSTDTAVIKKTLGLDRVAYPYKGGSWDDYIDYVKNSSVIKGAGYQKKYGYLTLVNYWLEQRPTFAETPDLWKTSEQPITAVKDALDVFLGYLNQVPCDDRLGLAVYTSADGTGKLESPLTNNFQQVADISRHRQAGHYDHYTNTGAGMQKGREELQRNGRAGAQKLMVLMTDGLANRPTSVAAAQRYVLEEARKAKEAGFAICTISLGAAADADLMQQVADITGGVHFNVPGGSNVADYEKDLQDVFRQIAGARKAALVK